MHYESEVSNFYVQKSKFYYGWKTKKRVGNNFVLFSLITGHVSKNLDGWVHFAQNFTSVCYKLILRYCIFSPKYVYEEEKCDEIILGFL